MAFWGGLGIGVVVGFVLGMVFGAWAVLAAARVTADVESIINARHPDGQ